MEVNQLIKKQLKLLKNYQKIMVEVILSGQSLLKKETNYGKQGMMHIGHVGQ
jgi:hypothetical protein